MIPVTGSQNELDTEEGEMMLALDALWVGDAANQTPSVQIE